MGSNLLLFVSSGSFNILLYTLILNSIHPKEVIYFGLSIFYFTLILYNLLLPSITISVWLTVDAWNFLLGYVELLCF